MSKIAIIGAGISGLTTGRLLQANTANSVVIYEKQAQAGGLCQCRRIDGSLFHLCGGHVFNSKRQDVLDWFWQHFDKESEFTLARRNSVISMQDGQLVPYPIEDHVYCLGKDVLEQFMRELDLIEQSQSGGQEPENFEQFLRMRFTDTLYRLYFGPYNKKIWRTDLSRVPLSWLEGKLPMPTPEQMRQSNLNHTEEQSFVHSSFYYERHDGSQFLVNRLAQGLDIRYDSPVEQISVHGSQVSVNGENYDKIVYCGNIKDLIGAVHNIPIHDSLRRGVEQLCFHGTTTAFCHLDRNPYSWIYQPSPDHPSHRIICTGNFSETNNAPGTMTGTVEFTDYISEKDIRCALERMSFNPQYITHHFSPCTYPIQDAGTRQLINTLRELLAPHGIYFTGRFADWEYYNMDAAMGAAMDLCHRFSI